MGLGDNNNRGDNSNEMGDALPFVSVNVPTTDPTSFVYIYFVCTVFVYYMVPALKPSSYPTIGPTVPASNTMSLELTLFPSIATATLGSLSERQ